MNSVRILTNCFFRPILISSYPFTPRAVPRLRRLVAGLSLGIGDSDTFQCILCGMYGEQSGTRTCFPCISFHSSFAVIFSRRRVILVDEGSSRLLALILDTFCVCVCVCVYIYIYTHTCMERNTYKLYYIYI